MRRSPQGLVLGTIHRRRPSDLSGLLLDLDARFATTSGSNVTAWPDRSGQGNNATPVNTPTLTTNQVNGRPAVTFVAASLQHFTLPNVFNALTAAEVFFVAKSSGATGALHNWHDDADLSNAPSVYPFSDNNIYDNFGATARKSTGLIVQPVNAYHLYNARSAAGAWSNFINNQQQFTTATNSVQLGTLPYIGRSHGTNGSATSDFYLSGGISRVLFFNRVLGSAERLLLLNYIRAEYGLTLS